MTRQQRQHEDRESERQRIAAAQMQPNSVRANYAAGVAGIAVCDNSGSRRYATLNSAAIDALMWELVEVQKFLRADMMRDDTPAPVTERVTP
jgi:hypothetical protein